MRELWSWRGAIMADESEVDISSFLAAPRRASRHGHAQGPDRAAQRQGQAASLAAAFVEEGARLARLRPLARAPRPRPWPLSGARPPLGAWFGERGTGKGRIAAAASVARSRRGNPHGRRAGALASNSRWAWISRGWTRRSRSDGRARDPCVSRSAARVAARRGHLCHRLRQPAGRRTWCATGTSSRGSSLRHRPI